MDTESTLSDVLRCLEKQTAHSIALQRAIEYHCRSEIIPDEVRKDCPYHADKLNDRLAAIGMLIDVARHV